MAQKHTTVRNGKRLLWYTERLWRESMDLAVFELPLDQFPEMDINCWFTTRAPTLREVSGHLKRVMDADLSYPVILNDDGSLMDGGHRLCKALIEGRTHIKAVQFPSMPSPDKIVGLDDY